MRTLVEQCEEHLSRFVRSGGKDNRENEVAKIVKFLVWVQANDNVLRIDRLGKKQVIGFWRAHRHLSERTTYDYWLAISKLWVWIGKTDEPPKPYSPAVLGQIREKWKAAKSPEPVYYTDIRVALLDVMEKQAITTGKLANMTCISVPDLERILAWERSPSYVELAEIMKALSLGIVGLEG